MLIQPKPYLDRLRHRNHAFGTERRRNMSKIILENQTFFPKPVTYEDIDRTFFEWVDKKLEVVYDGKRLPTYKLFSNQKLSEYSQTWQNLDDTGNIIMNFKTITRENNPQHGESQGGNYNVPGNRDYPMFYVPVLQENGERRHDPHQPAQHFRVPRVLHPVFGGREGHYPPDSFLRHLRRLQLRPERRQHRPGEIPRQEDLRYRLPGRLLRLRPSYRQAGGPAGRGHEH